MPVNNYDFQAPLGQYGQVREQYHLLRRLHMLLHEWGPQLADMPATMPDVHPAGKNDSTTLRWSVRSNGTNGFIFVNNYERHQTLPPKTNVQFALSLANGPLTFPEKPVTIPSDACLIWPFHLDLGHGVNLAWATAHPLTAIDVGNIRTLFFEQADSIPAQFAFSTNGPSMKILSGHLARIGAVNILQDFTPGTKPIAAFNLADGATIQIVVLNSKEALGLWKGNLQGRDRIFLSRANLVFDGNNLRVTSTNRANLDFGIYPAPDSLQCVHQKIQTKADGIFKRFTPSKPVDGTFQVSVNETQKPGPLRKISLGAIEKPVAAAPLDDDFTAAAVWTVNLPTNTDLANDPILRIHYVGDVARVMLNGKFITDDFYNGNAFDIGLRRHAPEILNGKLQIAILPFQKDAPIYMADKARAALGNAESIAKIQSIEIISRYHLQFTSSALTTSVSR
jgi:beta-galactosidase